MEVADQELMLMLRRLVEAKMAIVNMRGVVNFLTMQFMNVNPSVSDWNDQGQVQKRPQAFETRPLSRLLARKGCPDDNIARNSIPPLNIITSTAGRVCFASDHGGHQHRS